MSRSTIIACLVGSFLLGGCRSEDGTSPTATLAQRPAAVGREQSAPSVAQSDGGSAAPAPDPTPANPGSGSGYGAEKHRLVNQRDEIVSVLENGLTVIAK